MNEKEIITALENCSSAKPCKSCPRLNEVHCMTKLMGDALALIKSYQGRFDRIVERLEKEKSDWNDDYNVPINNAIKIVKGGGGDE